MIQSSRVKHVTIASQLWLAHIEEGYHYSKPHGRMRTSAFWSQSPTRALGNKRGMNCPTRTRFSKHHQKLHVNMPQYLVIMAWSGTTRKGEDVKIVKHANMRQTYIMYYHVLLQVIFQLWSSQVSQDVCSFSMGSRDPQSTESLWSELLESCSSSFSFSSYSGAHIFSKDCEGKGKPCFPLVLLCFAHKSNQ